MGNKHTCTNRESNPGQVLGRHLCYHYTIGARGFFTHRVHINAQHLHQNTSNPSSFIPPTHTSHPLPFTPVNSSLYLQSLITLCHLYGLKYCRRTCRHPLTIYYLPFLIQLTPRTVPLTQPLTQMAPTDLSFIKLLHL